MSGDAAYVRRRVVIRGHVQGVFFRDSCRRQAVAHDVNGWVRNLADGSVEAVFEGPKAAVASLVAWVRVGPPQADIDQVSVFEEPVAGEQGFEVRE